MKSYILDIFFKLFFLFSSTQTLAGTTTRIVWWNVHEGLTDKNSSTALFNQNLQELIGDQASPDFVILAEYSNDILSSHTRTMLDKLYPFAQFAPYGDLHKKNGIEIFAKRSFTTEAISYLDYLPANLPSGDVANYRDTYCETGDLCIRPYIQIHFADKSGVNSYTLVLTHLNDFWRKYFHSGRQNTLFRTLETLFQIAWGEKNPLWNQLVQFRQELQYRLGEKLETQKIVVMGDFNVPTTLPFTPLTTTGYRKLSANFRDTLFSGKTFPSNLSSEMKLIPKMTLDHVLVSKPVEVIEARVLPFSGSHHYPVSLEVN